MIASKRELRFYIMADRIMNGFPSRQTLCEKVRMLYPSPPPTVKIINFLYYMRMASYYKNRNRHSILTRLYSAWYSYKYRKVSICLGFSIGFNVFGYGLVIPHYGTIVVNEGVKAGNFCVLHTSTCIGGNGKTIGHGLYLSAGAKIMGRLTIGDGVSVASNSLVNKSAESNVLLAGCPAKVKRQNYPFWWERDGEMYLQRVSLVENLKAQMNINV